MDKVRKNKLAILLFMLPAVLLFGLIIVIPIFMSGYYSVLNWDGITKGVYIGFDNYKELFTNKILRFPSSIVHALLLALFSTAIQLPISLYFAIVLARGVKGERAFVAIFFVPVLISTVVIGQLWLKIYNPQYGLVNMALRALNLDHLTKTWLGDEKTALIAVFIPILWQYVGYHMLLMYAGIKSISKELNEAAMIDGATDWEVSKYITIPLLKPILRVCVIFAVTGSLKAFDLIYVLTNGSPASAVPSTLMVNVIFGRNRYGLGSSIAILIIALCFFFAILIRALFKTEVDE